MLKKFYLFSILSLQVLNTNAFDRHQLASSKSISSLVTETYAKKCFNGAGTSIDANGSCGDVTFKDTTMSHRGDHLHTNINAMGVIIAETMPSKLSRRIVRAMPNESVFNREDKSFALGDTVCKVDYTSLDVNCRTKLQPGELSSSYQTLLQQRVASLPKVSAEERAYRDKNHAATYNINFTTAAICIYWLTC